MTSTDHGRPAGAGALSPVFLGESPSHAELARTLLAQARHGTLCTLALEPAGFPYASVANFAPDAQGNPLLLTSDLAEHTRFFKADPRASFLVTETSTGDPLAVARLTLLGRVVPAADAREDYLSRHPGARTYSDFRDFSFYRLEVEALRWIGGFGRMSWVDLESYRKAHPDPIAPHAGDIRQHMNEDHQEAMVELAREAGVDATRATLVAVDSYGFEMAVMTPLGPRQVRLPFTERAASPDDVRKAFIALLKAARQQARDAAR